jgi:rhodanese-related sulfurtransferase
MMWKPFQQGLDQLEVDVPHVAEQQHDPNVQIVDCREKDEWDAGHMDGTFHIPLGALALRQKELDPTRPVVIVCRSGNRSLVAAKMLTSNGFRDAKSLAGGLIAWAQSGRPLVR